ncbi:SMP-30/gluconolactonase/LRE family protein [Myxococcota bacterium]|nr:SMP-30/gluconolactonase/LRE family protein [Myxococcota bacterium]
MGFRFTEGPAWVPALGQLLFTDLQTGTIHALTPPSAVAPWRMPSGGANGLAVDASGLVLAAEHQGRRVTRTLANGDITVVADAWQGMAFNSPNDLTVRRSDGTIYLSDPPWGLNGRPRQIPFNGLFRISPAGVVTAERQYPTAVNPNGVALSPDATRLYVALDTDAKLVVFDVAADGSLSNERDFVATSATPDGLAIDEEGNVYAATSAGIEVFAPDGARWGVITVPQQPANCGFGGANGRTLYVTARTALFAIDLRVRGAD